MEILQDSVLAKHLFAKYSANPKNWSFVISTSSIKDQFFDATISSIDEVWQLKIDSIYKPLPMVVGTKVDIDSTTLHHTDTDSNTIVPFGYRKIEPTIIMNILKTLTEEQQSNAIKEQNINERFYSILGSLQTERPVEGNSYAYGPLLFTERNQIKSNEYQKQVAERLSLQLRNHLRNRYSGYG